MGKVTIIGEHAFANCNKLRSIEISENAKEIHEDAFEGCIFDRVTTPERFIGIVFKPTEFKSITKLADGRIELKK